MKVIATLCFVIVGLIVGAQTCFDAYDNLFKEEYKKLEYKEFHKLELEFLANLKGCDAIEFNETSITGESLFLPALKGKVVVLNFWFTTCMPCLKEIPELNKLVEKYDADEVVFIGFARDDVQKLETFFRKFMPFNYKIVAESFNIADAYKVIGWPQSMVIDKSGKIYQSWAGLKEPPEVLRKQIEESINECL